MCIELNAMKTINLSQIRIFWLSRIGLATVFFYHGLVPKLLFRNAQEIEMNARFVPAVDESVALIGSGIAEIVFSLGLLICFRVRWFNYLIIAFGCLATIAIAFQLPHLLANAFNPFSTNLSIVLLAAINLQSAAALVGSKERTTPAAAPKG